MDRREHKWENPILRRKAQNAFVVLNSFEGHGTADPHRRHTRAMTDNINATRTIEKTQHPTAEFRVMCVVKESDLGSAEVLRHCNRIVFKLHMKHIVFAPDVRRMKHASSVWVEQPSPS